MGFQVLLRLAFTAGLTTALTVGCAATEPSAQTPPSAAASSGDEATQQGIVVSLDRAGEGERAPLRYRLVPGATERGEMWMHMTVAMDSPLADLPDIDTPPMTTEVSVQCVEARDDGTYRLRIVITGVQIDSQSYPPEVVAAVREIGQSMVGLSMDSVIDDRGRSLDVQMDIPSSVSPSLRDRLVHTTQLIRDLATPFPEEPVGVGASWKTETDATTQHGVHLRQRTTYTLIERDGDRVVLGVRIAQAFDPGAVQLSEPGSTLDLTSGEGAGSGQVTMDMGRIFPVASSSAARSHQEMILHGAQGDLPMSVEVEVTTRVAADP